jgi:hypothetical protein
MARPIPAVWFGITIALLGALAASLWPRPRAEDYGRHIEAARAASAANVEADTEHADP